MAFPLPPPPPPPHPTPSPTLPCCDLAIRVCNARVTFLTAVGRPEQGCKEILTFKLQGTPSVTHTHNTHVAVLAGGLKHMKLSAKLQSHICSAVGRLRQGLTETMTKWRASGIARQASHWKNFWTRDLKTDADLRSDILRTIKGVQSALLQAQVIVKQIDEAAEELLMQVRRHMCHGACGSGCVNGGMPGGWGERDAWGWGCIEAGMP